MNSADIADIDSFSRRVKKDMGFNLTEAELLSLFSKYGNKESNTIDYKRFMQDMSVSLSSTENEEHRLHPSSTKFNIVHSMKYEELMQMLRDRITARTGSSVVDNRIQKAFFLLSEPRSNILTKAQLKRNIQHRLSISLTNSQIDEIFDKHDAHNTGAIKTRSFVMGLFKEHYNQTDLSLTWDHLSNLSYYSPRNVSVAENPNLSYDNIFSGLTEPNMSNRPKDGLSIKDIEREIRNKIVERSSKKCNYVLTLIRCFGDAKDKDSKLGISKDQMKFTLWKRFQLPLTEDDINLLFRKYDRNNTGRIDVHLFIKGIIRDNEGNEPLIENPLNRTRMAAKGKESGDTSCVKFIRFKLMERIRREGRSPHDLLHGIGRMTREAFSTFMLNKFKTNASELFLDEIEKMYESGGLIDTRRLIHDAVSFTQNGTQGSTTKNMFQNASSSLELPASLRGMRYTPEEIENIFKTKVLERGQDRSPTSQIAHVFRVACSNDLEMKAISPATMKRVFLNYDLFLRTDDFDRFFRKHDRGDGRIDLQAFTKCLLPAGDHSDNPFNPKDVHDLQMHLQLADNLSHITGYRRNVSSFSAVDNPLVANAIKTSFVNMNDLDRLPSPRPSSSASTNNVISHLPDFDKYDSDCYRAATPTTLSSSRILNNPAASDPPSSHYMAARPPSATRLSIQSISYDDRPRSRADRLREESHHIQTNTNKIARPPSSGGGSLAREKMAEVRPRFRADRLRDSKGDNGVGNIPQISSKGEMLHDQRYGSSRELGRPPSRGGARTPTEQNITFINNARPRSSSRGDGLKEEREAIGRGAEGQQRPPSRSSSRARTPTQGQELGGDYGDRSRSGGGIANDDRRGSVQTQTQPRVDYCIGGGGGVVERPSSASSRRGGGGGRDRAMERAQSLSLGYVRPPSAGAADNHLSNPRNASPNPRLHHPPSEFIENPYPGSVTSNSSQRNDSIVRERIGSDASLVKHPSTYRNNNASTKMLPAINYRNVRPKSAPVRRPTAMVDDSYEDGWSTGNRLGHRIEPPSATSNGGSESQHYSNQKTARSISTHHPLQHDPLFARGLIETPPSVDSRHHSENIPTTARNDYMYEYTYPVESLALYDRNSNQATLSSRRPRRPETAPLLGRPAPASVAESPVLEINHRHHTPRKPATPTMPNITGRRQKVNPYSRTMMMRYSVSKRYTKTAQQEYGLFVKNINNAKAALNRAKSPHTFGERESSEPNLKNQKYPRGAKYLKTNYPRVYIRNRLVLSIPVKQGRE